MPGNRKLLIMISILLIPVLLAMTPINLFQKLSGQSHPCQDKQIQRSGSCLFNSLVSQDDLTIRTLNSMILVEDMTPSLHFQILVLDPSHNSSFSSSAPLRC